MNDENKALIVSGSNMRLMPYIYRYVEELQKKNYAVTVLYWDRDGMPDKSLPTGVCVERFFYSIENDVSKWKKIIPFYQFRRKIIAEMKHDWKKIIICDTQFGILIFDKLLTKWANKYILDIRDLSYEDIFLYRLFERKVIDCAKVVFVSSSAYQLFLPTKRRLIIDHNIAINSLKNRKKKEKRITVPLRISFWGVVRDWNANIKFINSFKNDERFEVHYYGKMEMIGRRLEMYCKENTFKNIFFHGEYLPEDIYKFAEHTDLLHNVYSNLDNGKSNPAMGNKFYDGLIFYLPQICMRDSIMGKQVTTFGVGVEVDFSQSAADLVWNYYTHIDWKKFQFSCDNVLIDILEEWKFSRRMLEESLSN